MLSVAQSCGTCNWYGSNFSACCNQSSGWGWENNQSCIGSETCSSQAGSGSSSSSSGSSSSESSSGSCSGYAYCSAGANDDPDGDGWGWDGSASCIVAGSAADSCGGGGSSGNNNAITSSSCSPGGSATVVTETIRVDNGGEFDGQCRTYTAGSQLGDGGQSEGQDPIFRVENGSTLRNVVIGNNGADGIHLRNGATLDNIYFQNVGEDAITVKESGTYSISNIEGYNAEDKFFQINAASTVNVYNCIIHNAGKALRQNGGTTFRIDVSFNYCDIAGMDEGIFRSDSSSSSAYIGNSRLHNASTTCIGNWSSCVSSNTTQY